jgi:hypothetical protein
MIRGLAIVALIVFASHPVQAGDCGTHPITLFHIQVTECAPLSAANMYKVSGHKYGGEQALVLRARILDRRLIEPDPPPPRWDEMIVHEWVADANAPEGTFLVLGDHQNVTCAVLPSEATLIVTHTTNCECDTSPARGNCVFQEHRIVTIGIPDGLSALAAPFTTEILGTKPPVRWLAVACLIAAIALVVAAMSLRRRLGRSKV